MLSPKRLLLTLGAFAVLFAGFLLYSQFLGQYDGLQPLPAEYRPGEPSGAVPASAPIPRTNAIIAKLEEAFGKNCEETNRRIRMQFPAQGIVMAAEHCDPVDGKLRVTNVSLAHFGQPADGKPPEINAIRGEQAIIEFDKPIADLREASTRKPIAGRIDGNVRLHNTRRTPDVKDDIRVFTDWLAYRDDQHRIWTDAPVTMKEQDPELRTVKATGLEVLLIPGEATSTKGAKKSTRPTITGLKQIRLDRDVNMTLLIEGNSTFLGGKPKETPGATPLRAELEALAVPGAGGAARQAATLVPAKPPSLTPVVVNCHGPFIYYEDGDVDRAEFQDRVTVIRTQEPAPAANSPSDASPRYDQLDCDKLVLTFQNQKDRRHIGSSDAAEGMNLISAHASGKQVELVSDSEKLHATGTDLVYEKATNTTTLRGDPVFAEQAGNQLRLKGVLTLCAADGGKELQEATARGPGEIRLRRENHPEIFARWRDELHSTKDAGLDKLTLRGQASFEDPLRGVLRADELSVWIDSTNRPGTTPALRKPEPPKKPDLALPAEAKDRMPRRLDAAGNASLTSAELVITKTERLRLQFEPGTLPPPIVRTPDSPAKPDPEKPPTAPKPAGTNVPGAPMQTPVANAPGSPSPAAKPQFLPPAEMVRKQPIELTARSVDAKLVHDGSRAELKDLRTEGQVHVLQRAATPADKALEIKGETLELKGTPDGYIAKIIGLPGEPAFAKFDKLEIIGHEVNINQPQNVASVPGVGSMKLPSKNDLQGNPLPEPMDVTIFWNRRMFFDGKLAEFDDSDEGGVIALQAPARLACRMLQVVFDQPVSLKGRANGQPDPGLKRLLCDKAVWLERGVFYDDGVVFKRAAAGGPAALNKRPRWREYQRIEAAELEFEPPRVSAYGPGRVILLSSGSDQALPGQPAGKTPANGPASAGPKPPPAPEDLRVTQIEYNGHLEALQPEKDVTIIKFIDGVEVVHLPASDPDVVVDKSKLPPGAVYVQCGRLQVLSRKISGNKTSNDFEARDRVRVFANDFQALADKMTYDESKDLLTLEGLGTGSATIWRQTRPGEEREPFSGKKLMHWVKENRTTVDDANEIRFRGPPAKPR